MSPRGFFSKEFIAPYFTSEKYLESDQHKKEVDQYIAMENRLRSWFGYPRFLAIKVLTALGFLAKPDDKQDK